MNVANNLCLKLILLRVVFSFLFHVERVYIFNKTCISDGLLPKYTISMHYINQQNSNGLVWLTDSRISHRNWYRSKKFTETFLIFWILELELSIKIILAVLWAWKYFKFSSYWRIYLAVLLIYIHGAVRSPTL